MNLAEQAQKFFLTLRWLPAWIGRKRPNSAVTTDVLFAVADHFEPSFSPKTLGPDENRSEQIRRVERWVKEVPRALSEFRDAEGMPFRHTYFYPAEQDEEGLLERLSAHCTAGWGEVEIHLHHGIAAPDTSKNTRATLVRFRNRLAALGELSYEDGSTSPRYAFVHGNWALGNSNDGRFCGVDDEVQILSETGCFADFTLPSAPNPAQVSKINALYECGEPLNRPTPHRTGRDLRCGRPPEVFPLIISGPLAIDFSRRHRGWPYPAIENSAITGARPASVSRFNRWRDAYIHVEGRPEWLFVKLHCHGMDPRDETAMYGDPMRSFLRELNEWAHSQGGVRIHFVTAREMVNVALAACEGKIGNAGEYRDYRFRRKSPSDLDTKEPA